MKQFKHKVYRFSLDCLLVFMVLGKYTQSTALHRLQEFMPQPLSIRIPGTRCVLKFVRSRETNTKSKIRKTGDTYQANAQAGEDRSLSFKLPGTNG